jgi:hypothetical protein
VGRVEQPIEITGPPSSDELKPNVERRSDRPQDVRRKRTEVTALNTRDRRLGHARQPREVRLSKLAPQSDRSDRPAYALVVHALT